MARSTPRTCARLAARMSMCATARKWGGGVRRSSTMVSALLRFAACAIPKAGNSAVWKPMEASPISSSRLLTARSTRSYRMQPTAFAATIRACRSIVRNATNGCPGLATAPWDRWARAFCSRTSASMQSGCATSARLSAPTGAFPMWHRLSGITTAITSRGLQPCPSAATCCGGSMAMFSPCTKVILLSRNG